MMSLQSSSLSALPVDLVEEILVRIPATSLQRLRSTCKQWNVLLSDQRFTKKHFDKAEKQFLVVMLRKYFTSSTRLNLLGLHDNNDPSSIEFKGELSLIDPTYSNNAIVSEVFHCNGLLLCTALTGLVVWNPCTEQTKWIEITDMNHEGKYTYVLGYESNKSCCNYKILKLSHIKTFDSEIYDLNSHSWRVLGNITPNFIISQHGVSLKGNTYWIAYKDEDDEESIYDFLISFDFTTETFGPRLCLPVKSYWFRDTISLSCVREERLSVFFQDDDTLKKEIWMSNNINESKAMSWSQFFKIDLNTHRVWVNVSFVLDEENKMIVCCDKKFGYDINDSVWVIGEDQYWRKVELEGRSDWPLMFSYVPSLVQI